MSIRQGSFVQIYIDNATEQKENELERTEKLQKGQEMIVVENVIIQNVRSQINKQIEERAKQFENLCEGLRKSSVRDSHSWTWVEMTSFHQQYFPTFYDMM